MDQNNNNNFQIFKIKGMQKDLSESSFDNNFAYENKNLRINIVDNDNVLFNLTNEKGTYEVPNSSFTGTPIGVKKYDTNKFLLFTTSNYDRIYNIIIDNNFSITELTNNNNFGWNGLNPLEIEHYKDGEKNYFYIVDGKNNLKTFVLENNQITISNNNLDYLAKITGNEKFNITTNISSFSDFYSGVIQYGFAYITKQGHKTNIIDLSNLIYITNYDENKGLEPNKKANISIKITLNNLSSNFDRVEIYSFFRSELNGEILSRKVINTKIQGTSIEFIDNNFGEIISYTELINRFNNILIASTICQKSGSLFLGNITTNNYTNLNELISLVNNNNITINNTSDNFISNNKYFIGLQLQDNYGNWSPVIYLGTGNNIQSITLSQTFNNKCIQLGYIAYRAMLLDNFRIRNTIAEGFSVPSFKLENGKYGIDQCASYFLDIDNNDIYNHNTSSNPDEKIKINNPFYSLYSPDIEFDNNLSINNSDYTIKFYSGVTKTLPIHDIDISIDGNTGTLYNATSNDLGTAGIENFTINYNKKYLYYWNDAITGYQKSLQFLFKGYNVSDESDEIGTNLLSTLYNLSKCLISEKPTKYVIYVWQPSGSLNDSTNTSILKTKKIVRKYILDTSSSNLSTTTSTKLYIFDGTNNNIPIENNVYGGNLNLNINKTSWSINESYRESNYIGNHQMYSDDQINIVGDYSLATLTQYKYNGQPIEIYYGKIRTSTNGYYYCYESLSSIYDDDSFQINNYQFKYNETGNIPARTDSKKEIYENDLREFTNNIIYPIHRIPTIIKSYDDSIHDSINNNNNFSLNNLIVRGFDDGQRLIEKPLFDNESDHIFKIDISNKNKRLTEIAGLELYDSILKLRVTNNFNRNGQVKITYKTQKHLISKPNNYNNYDITKFIINKNDNNYQLTNKDIENGRWIICSSKYKIPNNNSNEIEINLNEKFTWNKYQCLKTEPYSEYDTNQVICIVEMQVNSYFNPLCRYDNFISAIDYKNINSTLFNKINTVYNQKNNFFIFGGFTTETISENNLNNSIIYTSLKLSNEKEDTFINFKNTDFYNIDTNINKINKIITYNDQLLCLGDTSILKILYNENIVINTEGIESLGLASSNKISGAQLISNSIGCLNKWSIGIFNNILFFNDDLNKKIVAFSNEGIKYLNEELGIENLNSNIFKNKIWNPVNFENTKLNIDIYSKDINFCNNNFDIAFNNTIGCFTSLYSYNDIPYYVCLNNHTVAIKNNKLYYLREGDYNYFFGSFQPYWTVVILNNNSLINKTITNIEFVTECYLNNIPEHNKTFNKISVYNDYQQGSKPIIYKIAGISSLKKKFRIWRISYIRNSTRMNNRNYDMISNNWNYIKFSTENINNSNDYNEKSKLTLHWIKINYK